ncbi:uncharacterized protein L199_000556 [Kwoniella botswanensis]|uniref:uncharacterized protein n=1 Tax=Kwoniella botswanensis TaxID=1268659 RepID=UPI00315D3215
MSDLPSTIPKGSWIETIQDNLCIASQQVTSDFQRIYQSLTQSGQQEWALINRSVRSVQPTIEGGQPYIEVTLDWKLANYYSKKEAENLTIIARRSLHFKGAAPTSTNIDGILSYNPPMVEESMVRPRVVRRGNL